jgi:Ca2+-binding RTX toxin-like protein
MQIRCGWLGAAAVVATLAGPASASAGTVDMTGGAFTYTGTAGLDQVSLFAEKDDAEALVGISLRDWEADEVTLTANARAAGCKYEEEFHSGFEPGDTIFEPNVVRCPVPASIAVQLGDGDDSLSHNTSAADGLTAPMTAVGGTGNDELRGGPGNDTLHGDAGDDLVYGYEGDDRLLGGDGNDLIAGMDGADVLDGGNGDDGLEAIPIGSLGDKQLGPDSYTGGPGTDRLSYFWISDPVSVTFDGQANDGRAGEGDSVASDIEDLTTGSADDTLIGDDRPLTLYGAEGNDTIRGGAAPDAIWGGRGDDNIAAGGGNDKINGDEGSDAIDAGPGQDEVIADRHCDGLSPCISGLDTIRARDGEVDLVLCGAYNDTLIADAFDNYTRDGGQHHCENVQLPGQAGAGQTGPPSATPGPTGLPAQPAVAAPRTLKIKNALKKGLRLEVNCPVACTATATATVDKKSARKLGLGRSRTLAKGKLRSGTGKRRLVLKVSSKARKRLAKQKKLTVSLKLTAKDASGSHGFTGRVTLKR